MKIDGIPTFDAVTVFEANIMGSKLILALPWLKKTDFQIGWYDNTVLFAFQKKELFSEKVAAIRLQVISVHNISATFTLSILEDSSNSAPAVACVSFEELIKICNIKNPKTFMVE